MDKKEELVSKDPVVRREGTKLVVKYVSEKQFAELLCGMRVIYGGRLEDSVRAAGVYEICFASAIKRKERKSNLMTLRRPTQTFGDLKEELMKCAEATARILLQDR